MFEVKPGDTVRLLYIGTLDNGETFDASSWHDNKPLEFKVGAGQVIPGFEEAVIGMRVNQTKIVHIAPDEAYGKYHEELVDIIRPDEYPQGYTPRLGDQFNVPIKDGSKVTVTVTDLYDDGIQVDGNHPLAGKSLNFEITLVEML